MMLDAGKPLNAPVKAVSSVLSSLSSKLPGVMTTFLQS